MKDTIKYLNTYNKKDLSRLVLTLFYTHGMQDRKEMAKVIGVTPGSFNGKLSRNSFSMEDIIKITKEFGMSIFFSDYYKKEDDVVTLKRSIQVKPINKEENDGTSSNNM